MNGKPKTYAGYDSEQTRLVRSACLYIATKLGDMMEDLLIVGGLVPSLIIDQTKLPEGVSPHVGTLDLDVGLKLALLNDERYRTLTERLRDADFKMDENEHGRPTRQRWAIREPHLVTIDFLIPPTDTSQRGGKLFDIEKDFAAIIAPGLTCAFKDRQLVTITGETIKGEKATRTLSVCGAGGFIVLKALAFDIRGENKDAYDLFYVIRNYGGGPPDIAKRLQPLRGDDELELALKILRRDFDDPDSVGPRRAAEFITGGVDDDIQADVVGFVAGLLSALETT